jgi:oxygen-independent coproporphyrinogen-3 oxidase
MTDGVGKIDRNGIVAQSQRFLSEYRTLKDAGFINSGGGFFPSVHYPPITMYQPITADELFTGYTVPADGLFDIYVHIPFCAQRCLFCHYPAMLGADQDPEKDRYLDALEKEMDIYLRHLGLDRIKARSVLIGGGTPTYLTSTQLRRFLNSFAQRVDLSHCTQFNYDVDPNTLLGSEGAERLRLMKEHGVDRLTIGVQSLHDRTLVNMNRHHSARESLDAIDESRKYGFKLNIEFIFGYPGQAIDVWIDEMAQAMTLDVDEIQLYRLKIDAYGDYQGPIKTIIEKNSLRVLTDEETLLMKRAAIDMLTAGGFHENIRRVFSRKRHDYSRYAWNQCCMLYDEVGFGLTAFSSLRDRFGLNTQYFEEYYGSIAAGKLPLNRGLIRNREEQQRWGIILPLKNSAIRKNLYLERTGTSLAEVFQDKMKLLKEFGLIVEDEHAVTPTGLGAFFADELVHQFHSPPYIPFPRSDYGEGPLNPYNHQSVIHSP